MRRLLPILRCKTFRREAATRTRIVAFSAVCIATTVSLKVLLSDQPPVARPENVPSGSNEEFAKASSHSLVDQAAEMFQSGSSSSQADWPFAATKSREATPRVTRERFNAALAAGLIDPSRIGVMDALPPVLKPLRERVLTFNGPGISIQNPINGPKSDGPLVTEAIAPMSSFASSPTKPMDAVPSLALAIDKAVPESPSRLNQTKVLASEPSPSQNANNRSGQLPKNKSLPVRLTGRAGVGLAGGSDAQETSSKRPRTAPGSAKSASSADKKPEAKDSPTQHLSENFQRFASEFVRANQTGNFAEQNRFFADSVHFYDEGDLSLASVASATQRHHREQQTKRSEIAGPAVAKGPVNGGFFVIEQPVRWTQSQGKSITQGRSVLQLRVLPSNNGNWKITSIDEIKK